MAQRHGIYFGGAQRPLITLPIGGGDFLVISIWRDAALFGSAAINSTRTTPSHATTLPNGRRGGVHAVPFAGRIPAAGKTLPDIAAEIKRALARQSAQCCAPRNLPPRSQWWVG